MIFKVIDKKTGKEPTNRVIDNIAKKGGLMIMDIDQFFVGEDGSLVLADDCGSITYCDTERFKVIVEQEPCKNMERKIEKEYLFESLCEDLKKLQTENEKLRKTSEQEPMREFTEEEANAYSKVLDKMYKPTGYNVLNEPCEDCVSRDKVHEMLENVPINPNDKWFNWLQKACLRLAELPSVQPKVEQEPKTDRIEYGTDGNLYRLTITNGKEYEQEPKTDVALERYKDLQNYFSDKDIAKAVLENQTEFKAWLERLRWNTQKVDELVKKLEALENEPILDKIKEEFSELVGEYTTQEIWEIIDKYRQESNYDNL